MGIISEKCLGCQKDKEEKENELEKKKSNTYKTEIKDKYCKVKLTIESNEQEDLSIKIKNPKKLTKSFRLLYNNVLFTNPFDSYTIKTDISDNIKEVFLNIHSKICRLLIIIPGSEELNDDVKKKSFLKKVKDLQLLDHPNLCKIYDLYIYENNYYLITDYSGDNNVLNKIKDEGIPEDSSIKIIMSQILNFIMYLHNNEIFDISLQIDNLFLLEITLLTGKKTILKKGKKSKEINNNINQNPLKRKFEIILLITGYLKDYYDISDLNHILYYSPEIIEKIEDNDILKNNIVQDNEIILNEDKKDEWSCGIIMYYLITGEFPFNGSTQEEIFNKIKNGKIDFSSSKFNSVSEECKDLLSKLLEKDENKRINANECFDHPFFAGVLMKKESEEAIADNLKILFNIKKSRSKFHEIIIAYLCFNFIDKTEEKKLSDLFKYIDKDHNSVITEKDIKDSFDRVGIEYTQEQINNILDVFDYDNNHFIQYQEFLRILCDKQDLFKEDNLKSVFQAIDFDKTDYIDIDDIKKFITHDEENKNIIEEEYMEPFGMKPHEKMIYEQFCTIIKEDKLYSEVNNKISKKIKKIKDLKKLITGNKIEQ